MNFFRKRGITTPNPIIEPGAEVRVAKQQPATTEGGWPGTNSGGHRDSFGNGVAGYDMNTGEPLDRHSHPIKG